MTKVLGIPINRGLRNLLKKNIYNFFYRVRLKEPVFPPEVWIENTNLCNARCVMCPRDTQIRKQGTMKMQLFKQIIDQVAQYKDRVKRVHLHNFGEPLIDAELPAKIKFAKSKGIKYLYFVTNASLLYPEISEQLIASGLDEFKISFYGTDADSYNQTMRGLNFDSTMLNVRNFFKLRKDMLKNGIVKSVPSVTIQYLPQESNQSRIGEFRDIFEKIIDRTLGDGINIFSLHNFGGGRDSRDLGNEICTICDYPWRTMIILWNGEVVPCCLDYNGMQVIGDVKNNSIREIWNGDGYNKLRQNFKKLDYRQYRVCLKCDRTR